MCGRFTLHSRLNLLLQQFGVQVGAEWSPRYNIAPTQMVPVVRIARATGDREMALLRWGLVPSWAKDISIGNRMINARSETVGVKPSFRSAMKRRRCLVPADGYFEWRKSESGKQPYYIQLRDESPFGMAGLWESWRADRSDAVETFTVITTESNEATSDIHDRMPAILRSSDYEPWLDPEFDDPAVLQSMLRPFEDDELQVNAVSTLVNNPRNDDPNCIKFP